jgi:hypothetical protein
MRFRYPNVCYGLIAYIASLLGTLLLANELARPWAVFMLISAAALGVITWGRQEWIPAFPLRYSINAISGFNRSRLFYLLGVISAILVGLGADLRYLAAPERHVWASRSSMVGKHRLVAVRCIRGIAVSLIWY